jgi:hypothetical protein
MNERPFFPVAGLEIGQQGPGEKPPEPPDLARLEASVAEPRLDLNALDQASRTRPSKCCQPSRSPVSRQSWVRIT